jgi:hypothetical protein
LENGVEERMNIVKDEIRLASNRLIDAETNRPERKALWEEIQEQMFYIEEDRQGAEGVYDETDALNDIMDVTQYNGDAPIMLKQCREIAIKLGWYKEVSEDELSRTIVTRGKKYDFKLDGKKYKWDSDAQ